MTFLFSSSQDKTQKFILTYVELDKHLIQNQLSRDETWYKSRHSGWTYILNKLIDSINKEGLRYPLCVVFKDGNYVCTHGGQRLAASLKSKLSTIPCIVAFRDWDMDKIPASFNVLQNYGELDSLNLSDIERIHLSGSVFEILVRDRQHWDPNDYENYT